MDIKLTEKMIRDRAGDQSYEKGRAYYRSGAIYDPSWQSVEGGIVLTAHCERNEFSEQKSMEDLLADMEKDALVTLLARLVERKPDLYAIPSSKKR